MKVFPLPYSSEIHNGTVDLSWHSRGVILATVKFVAQYPDAQVVLIGEQTYGSTTHTTVEPMKEFLLAHGIPEPKIIYNEKICNNTYLQLEELKKQFSREEITLIAFAFHAPRILTIARTLELNIKIELVENILRPIHSNDKTFQNTTSKMYGIRAMELLLRFISFIDPHNKIQNTITAYLGPRKPFF